MKGFSQRDKNTGLTAPRFSVMQLLQCWTFLGTAAESAVRKALLKSAKPPPP